MAFGSIGIPVITLAGITGLPLDRLSADVGRICAPISLIIPAYLIVAMGGWKALKGSAPCGRCCRHHFLPPCNSPSRISSALSSPIFSARLAAMGAVIVLLKFWRPACPAECQSMHEAICGVCLRRNNRRRTKHTIRAGKSSTPGCLTSCSSICSPVGIQAVASGPEFGQLHVPLARSSQHGPTHAAGASAPHSLCRRF